jgi:transcriptional repressor NrdR
MVVVKKGGTRQPFDRNKLRRGLELACGKRPVSSEQIDGVVVRIEQSLISRPTREVASLSIGEMVMNELKELDPVAYIRFASVYRDFHDAGDFQEAVNQLARP